MHRQALAVHSMGTLGHSAGTLGHMECCVDVISSPSGRRVKKSYWLDTWDNRGVLARGVVGERSVNGRRAFGMFLQSARVHSPSILFTLHQTATTLGPHLN